MQEQIIKILTKTHSECEQSSDQEIKLQDWLNRELRSDFGCGHCSLFSGPINSAAELWNVTLHEKPPALQLYQTFASG